MDFLYLLYDTGLWIVILAILARGFFRLIARRNPSKSQTTNLTTESRLDFHTQESDYLALSQVGFGDGEFVSEYNNKHWRLKIKLMGQVPGSEEYEQTLRELEAYE